MTKLGPLTLLTKMREVYVKSVEHLCLVDLVVPSRYNERHGDGGGECSGCCPIVPYHSCLKINKSLQEKGPHAKITPQKTCDH